VHVLAAVRADLTLLSDSNNNEQIIINLANGYGQANIYYPACAKPLDVIEIYMDSTFYFFLMAFLLFPVIPVVFYQFIRFEKISTLVKVVISFLLLYDILFLFGFSFKGDFTDYFIFSIEYLLFCFTLCLKSKKMYANVLRLFARAFIIIGFVIGLIGIFIFPVMEQDYKCDKIYRFGNNERFYEIRRYSNGFVTAAKTRYTFVTFRQYPFIPIEKKMGKTVFLDTETNLDFDEDKLYINLSTINEKERIYFRDNEGNVFSKMLE
jgi:hypothetical protein